VIDSIDTTRRFPFRMSPGLTDLSWRDDVEAARSRVASAQDRYGSFRLTGWCPFSLRDPALSM
jgi:hypothetical protein